MATFSVFGLKAQAATIYAKDLSDSSGGLPGQTITVVTPTVTLTFT